MIYLTNNPPALLATWPPVGCLVYLGVKNLRWSEVNRSDGSYMVISNVLKRVEKLQSS